MRLRRLPALYWILAFGLAISTSVTVFRLTAAADARARHWGTLAEVPIATSHIAAGDTLGPDDYELRRVPESLLPEPGVATEPDGLTALVPLWPGEVLVESKFAPAGLDGPAALLEPGERAVAVPRIETTPPVSVGDRVDVVLTLDATAAGGIGPPAVPVALAARVVHVDEEAVTLAVPATNAPRVAFGAAQSALSLAVAPPADWGSAASGRDRDYDSAGDNPIQDEGGEAPRPNELEQTPDRAESGDGGGSDPDDEGPAEAGRDSAGPN